VRPGHRRLWVRCRLRVAEEMLGAIFELNPVHIVLVSQMMIDAPGKEREADTVCVVRRERPWAWIVLARLPLGAFVLPNLRIVVEGHAVAEVVGQLVARTDRDCERQVAGRTLALA
jgi:hypothetical protein